MKKTLIITAFALIGLSINVKAQTAYISNESNNTVSVINVAVKFHHVVNGITPPSFAKGA